MRCVHGDRIRSFRLALTSGAIAGALFAVAPSLHAQEADGPVAAQNKEDAPASAVRVFITTTEDDVLLTVAQPGEQLEAIVSCHHQCSFWGVPGSYTLWATSPERDLDYETTLHVAKPTAFRVSSGHPGARTAGLITGIVGPLVIVGGALMVLEAFTEAQACSESNCEAQNSGKPYLGVIGVGAILVGALATPVGWSVYAANGPRVDAVSNDSTARAQPSPSPLHVGLLPLPRGGWGFGVSTVF